jgi:hypothetical protein
MERDKGIEPSPRPWQGRVLPLYESRVRKLFRDVLNFYSTPPACEQGPARSGSPYARTHAPRADQPAFAVRLARLIDFHDPSGFNDRRLLLALCKPRGALAINVHTGKFLAIAVIDGYLPMPVLASLVAVESAALFPLLLFHDGVPLGGSTIASSGWPRKYLFGG